MQRIANPCPFGDPWVRIPPSPIFMRLEGRKIEERIYRGKEAEWHCLGYGKNWEKIIEENNIKFPSPRKREEFIEAWVRAFKRFYPKEEAINPKAKSNWSTDLFDMVAKYLGLDIQNPEDQGLYFYNTLDSGLDYKGIDALFIFNDPKTKQEKRLTIDLTENPEKDEWKADYIINKIPFRENLGSEKYEEKMDEIAEKIADGLKNKTELIH